MEKCIVCRNFFKQTDKYCLDLEFTPEQLEKSGVERGCQWCAALLRSILLMEDSSWSFFKDIRILHGYGSENLDSDQKAERISLVLIFHHDGLRLNLDFFCVRSENGIAQSRGRNIGPATCLGQYDPMSQQAVQWVSSMLEDCINNHPCLTALESPLPARILALDTTSNGGFAVRLVQGKRESRRYAALSHCWGSQLTCTTTSENLDTRLRGIPWSELPQTFKDAVRYCLRLNIFYLWIDALCILQDDKKDWQTHSAKMAGIYQNAFITLAATSAANGSVGCFPTQALARQEKFMAFNPTPGDIYRILIRRELSHRWIHADAYTKLENPLLSRGWTFQERILSPRVLHFCREELVWECSQGTVCECGSMPEMLNAKKQFTFAASRSTDDGYGLTLGQHIRDYTHAGISRSRDGTGSDVYTAEQQPLALKVDQEQLQMAIDQWQGIVQQYSALDLTKPSDRLPALSGISERMAPYLGDFMAGLWKSSILSDLLWRVDDYMPGIGRPPIYVGPSWSWVSVNSKVSFIKDLPKGVKPYQPAFYYPRVTHIPESYKPAVFKGKNVIVTGENRYGEIYTATIAVEGNIRRVRLLSEAELFPDVALSSSSRWYIQIGLPGAASSMHLPFWPDYDLKLRKRWLKTSQKGTYEEDIVFLLMIKPGTFLVIMLIDGKIQNDQPVFECLFERIGILQAVEGSAAADEMIMMFWWRARIVIG